VPNKFGAYVLNRLACCRQQRDPIEHVRKLLLDNGFADASELKKLEKVRHCTTLYKWSTTMICCGYACATVYEQSQVSRKAHVWAYTLRTLYGGYCCTFHGVL